MIKDSEHTITGATFEETAEVSCRHAHKGQSFHY